MVSDVIAALGFLRDTKDDNERKKQEKELFTATKQLIIEFVELIETEEDRNKLYEEYRIHLLVRMRGGDCIANYIQGARDISLFLACKSIIRAKYKLTKVQIDKIISIIKDMPPSLIEDTYLEDFRNDRCVFVAPDQSPVILDRQQQEFVNLDKLPQRLQELQNGEWDNFIKTAIKELG